MREILFRGKRASDGKWLYGFYCDDKAHDVDFPCIIPLKPDVSDSDWDWAIIPETVGQYTGKMRFDGTKLFEGDVFWDANYEQEFTVEWNSDVLAWVATDDSSGSEFLSDIWNDSCTILRSIHDNPELLEGAAE